MILIWKSQEIQEKMKKNHIFIILTKYFSCYKEKKKKKKVQNTFVQLLILAAFWKEQK